MVTAVSGKYWKEAAQHLFRYYRLLGKACRCYHDGDDEQSSYLYDRAHEELILARKCRSVAISVERGD